MLMDTRQDRDAFLIMITLLVIILLGGSSPEDSSNCASQCINIAETLGPDMLKRLWEKCGYRVYVMIKALLSIQAKVQNMVEDIEIIDTEPAGNC